MTPTDTQLKTALAKLLDYEFDNGEIWSPDDSFVWYKNTELPYLCWLVEAALDEDGQEKYSYELSQIIPQNFNCGPAGFLTDDGDIMVHREFDLLHASWQQRVIALAKVKGVEIV